MLAFNKFTLMKYALRSFVRVCRTTRALPILGPLLQDSHEELRVKTVSTFNFNMIHHQQCIAKLQEPNPLGSPFPLCVKRRAVDSMYNIQHLLCYTFIRWDQFFKRFSSIKKRYIYTTSWWWYFSIVIPLVSHHHIIYIGYKIFLQQKIPLCNITDVCYPVPFFIVLLCIAVH